MSISAEQVKSLRNQTGLSVMQCKKALEEAGGDAGRAIILLKKKGSEVAANKSSRSLCAGVVQSYIHASKTVGAMVELLCETDFVAKNEEFRQLAYDLAMHITALDPEYIKADNISAEIIKKVKDSYSGEVEKMNKPNDIKEKILEGKLKLYFKEQTLLEQTFIKNEDLTVAQLIEGCVQKFGENIEVARFVRYSISR